MLVWVALNVMGWNRGVRFFCGDETRIGLKTIGGRKITARGVKPRGQMQWQFLATYIYGIAENLWGRSPSTEFFKRVEPKTGEHFFYEFSPLNTDCFQVFLQLVFQQFPDDLLIIQLDNGAFHKAKRLNVPRNIILLFQPPHCPELNPIEQVWQYLKRRLRWSLPTTLNQLRQQLRERLEALTLEIVQLITGRSSILNALSVAAV